MYLYSLQIKGDSKKKNVISLHDMFQSHKDHHQACKLSASLLVNDEIHTELFIFIVLKM
jgi:hypothetical protein